MSTETPKQYSWSTDEETFHDQCDSLEAAVASAIDYHGGDMEIGQTIYVGEVKPVATSSLVGEGNIVERMQEMAYEYAGESSEDYLHDVTTEQFDELRSLVAAWADRVQPPTFWQVLRSVPYVITAEDLEPSNG